MKQTRRRFPLPFIGLLFAACCALTVAAADDTDAFKAWVRQNSEIAAFEKYLDGAQLGGVIPSRQLLRTASDWQRCMGPQFDIPPPEQWPEVLQVLRLVAELKQRKILRDFETASAYRNPPLNACAKGAKGSSHTVSFAVDILPNGAAGVDELALCQFWQTEGQRWMMGLSKYPSGRIHLDTSGWRTWGATHKRASAWCTPLPRKERPAVLRREQPKHR